MRQSPRLAAPQSGTNRGPANAPDTPQRSRTGKALDGVIRSLEAEHRLGLQVRDDTWSPRKDPNSLADKVYGQIKRCFFSSEPALSQTLEEFKKRVGNQAQKERLELLHRLLRSQTSSPHSAKLSRSQTSQPDSHKSLRPQAPVPATSIFQTSNVPHTEDPESIYTTAPESGSTTEDDELYSAPPSPTASIKHRRQSPAGAHVTLGPPGKKRPSQSSEEDGSSPKVTRTSKGKRPSTHQSSPINTTAQGSERKQMFKKPSLEMAQSHRVSSAQTSFATSFNSNTVWSSQQTGSQPETAMTSFNSNFGGVTSTSTKVTRTSSTTMGSLDDQDLLEVDSRLEKEHTRQSQTMTRDSSTTFGSIDEDDMVIISRGYEEMNNDRASQVRRANSSPTRHGLHAASSAARDSFADRKVLAENLDGGLAPLTSNAVSPGFHTAQESPTRMSHHIRNLPLQNLFVADISEVLRQVPYFILFISLRIATQHNIPLHELMDAMDVGQVSSDPDLFWNTIQNHPGIPALSNHEAGKIWLAAQDDFTGYTFKGKVVLNHQRESPVFSIDLLPIEKENPCRFQRAFGADRFLYLNFPAFDSGSRPTRFDWKQMEQIQYQWGEWCNTEHSFLGRKWRAFHVEPIRKAKGSRRNDNESYGIRVVLFATRGIGIKEPYSIGEMLNWFFPFGNNLDQSFCKAFARLDLGLSRTVPTLVFKPSQILHVDDIEADNTPEATQFNDLSLQWDKTPDKAVMNDGCSLLSLGAAQEIWQLYKKETGVNERLPSAFQARIGGAKGLWVVSPEPYSNRYDRSSIWIQISKSQRKFQPHAEDLFDESFDPLRLTFELVNYSTRPAPSDLHLSFISIMVDRGIPREAIQKLMAGRLDMERDQLLDMLGDPVTMYDWVHKQGVGSKDSENMLWQAAMPSILGDRIKVLLESGFLPTEEPYLANSLRRLIKQQQLWEEQKLRIPLGKSTFLYGVADPLGVLAPGEIHIQFSTWFIDDTTDENYLSLEDVNVLVARQPACRRSDLQKVRAVCHSQLGHLVDVVVFPTRGQFPLAGKLQGGDYDGDIFWICWEPTLVEPFRNAPAPLQSADPSQYNIKQHTTKLREIIVPHDLSSVDSFLKEAITFRIGPSLLGKVTNYLEKEAYAANKIYSYKLDCLADMHDLLVDAPKQGYSFSDRDFDSVKKTLRLPRVPKPPAYKDAMEACANAKEMGEGDKIRKQKWEFNPANAIDHLYFNVVRAHHVETQTQVEQVLSKDVNNDPALQYPYLREREKGDVLIEHEFKRLLSSLETICLEWNKGMTKNGRDTTADEYNATVDKCYRMFTALQPEHIHTSPVKTWVEPYVWANFTKWEMLRASVLYTHLPKKAAFVFHMAGKELAELKGPPSRSSRRVCGRIFATLRPKVSKIPKKLEQVSSDDDDEFETPLEELL